MAAAPRRRTLHALLATAVAVAAIGVGVAVVDPGHDGSVVTAGGADDLHGPGTPIFEGLVVPLGARLLAPPRPGAGYDRLGSADQIAGLQIVGDPLALWADLVDQVTALGGTLPSSGACFWNPGDGVPAPLSAPRPPGRMTVECVAGASFVWSGAPVDLALDLWLTPAGAELSLGALHGRPPSGPIPTQDPGPVTSADLRGLPEDRTPPAPGVGDAFGEENDCFEHGYARFRVPAGARFVGGGRTPATTPVLDVDDPEAALRALRDQLDEPEDTSGTYEITHETHAGEVVWSLRGSVAAGGGTCEVYSVDDGKRLVVTAWSD